VTSDPAPIGPPEQAVAPQPLRQPLQALGARIRAERKARQLSSVALARRVGVSPSLISQVERGVTAPSLDVLWRIAQALDASIGLFFQDSPSFLPEAMLPSPPERDGATPEPRPRAIVVRRGARKTLGLPNSVTYELLSPDLQHRIEFIWVEFAPGQSSPVDPYVHAGEEQFVVLQGTLHYWVGGEEYVLEAGDAITFDSSLPHRGANLGNERVIVIGAITPPSF
jgi:transcriptional regulator with XRE-family HTH domain